MEISSEIFSGIHILKIEFIFDKKLWKNIRKT